MFLSGLKVIGILIVMTLQLYQQAARVTIPTQNAIISIKIQNLNHLAIGSGLHIV